VHSVTPQNEVIAMWGGGGGGGGEGKEEGEGGEGKEEGEGRREGKREGRREGRGRRGWVIPLSMVLSSNS